MAVALWQRTDALEVARFCMGGKRRLRVINNDWGIMTAVIFFFTVTVAATHQLLMLLCCCHCHVPVSEGWSRPYTGILTV